MVNKDAGAIVIDSTKEKNEKIKKRWQSINNFANTLTKVSTSGFIVSLLSPFEFDGPIVEIVTAVAAGVGFVIKKASEARLSSLGETKQELLDKDDENTLLTVTSNLGQSIPKKR